MAILYSVVDPVSSARVTKRTIEQVLRGVRSGCVGKIRPRARARVVVVLESKDPRARHGYIKAGFVVLSFRYLAADS